jgi:AraC-like DNA-binding protein
MRDLTRIPILSPYALLGSGPRPRLTGPMRFAFADLDERGRSTLLHDCFARMGVHYEFKPLRDAPFHVDLAFNALPGLQIALGALHASRRRGTRELAAEGTDDIGLTVNLKGAHRVEQRGREIVLADGEAVFTSCADTSSFTQSLPGEMLILRFPRARFAPLVNGMDDRYVRTIPRADPALQLLRSYAEVAWDAQAEATPDLQQCFVAHLYDLMAVMIGATRDGEAIAQGRGLRAAHLHAIKQDIAGQLARPDLSVAVLSRRHCRTPRSIQRLFEAEGTTFTDYVLAQRLARAHGLLGDPRRRDEKISAVALDCGFGDVSYFNRMFRRHYGAAPSDVRAQARRNGSSH